MFLAVTSRLLTESYYRYTDGVMDCINIVFIGNKSNLKEKAVDAGEAKAFADKAI
jgi:hypothetical protein